MISRTNMLLYGFSGRAGNMVVKNYGDKMVLSKLPDMENRVLSPKQKELNSLMKDANIYAKSVVANPQLKEEACTVLGVPSNKIYRALVKEFIKRKEDVDYILPSRIRKRPKQSTINHKQHIESNPSATGKPMIKGTDITVAFILEQLSKGITIPELLDKHPSLNMQKILAALAFASEKVSAP